MGKRGRGKGSGQGKGDGRRGQDREKRVGEGPRTGKGGEKPGGAEGSGGSLQVAGGAGKAAAKAQLVCSVLGRGLFWGRGDPWHPSENPPSREGAGECHSTTQSCRDTGTELLQQPPSHSDSVPRTGATGL